GPHSATVSRTDCVTSPAVTRATDSASSVVLSASSASGSYASSAASASTTECVGTTATDLDVSASTCRATATMFLLLGSTITESLGQRSTASRICAVDGFIDWPPATIHWTPRLARSRRTPSPTAIATTAVSTRSSGACTIGAGAAATATQTSSSTCSQSSV